MIQHATRFCMVLFCQQKRCNMQVLIMRHGDAALEAASDSLRPLTQCGRDESLQMAIWLNAKSVGIGGVPDIYHVKDIDRVLVSPYLRAEQTLQTVRGALTLPDEEDILPELTPGGDTALVAAYLQALAKEGTSAALVVSHLPLVGYLVADLCPGECAPMFATSAIASVELDAESGQGKYEWQISPTKIMAKVV